MQRQNKQIFRRVDEWEEIQFNMWGSVENKQAALEWARGFTADHKLYGSFMRRVIDEWPISCENALTDPYINQKAWLGHAACALAGRVPEDVIREAWKDLTGEQKLLANKEAERAIELWKERHFQNRSVHKTMGEPLLF
jgi:hypothetical protein